MNNVSNTSKQKNMFQTIFLILFYVFIVVLIIYFIFINTKNITKNSNKYLKSVEVVGYNLDKDFSENLYDYTVVVEKEKVEITCDTNYDIKGCNETIDLTGKDSYQHEIILNASGQEKKYTINIVKNTNEIQTNQNLKISSIEGNPKTWTNKDVNIKVNAIATNGIDSYSFDGGNTWQKENFKVINQNQILNIIVKDKKGQTTQAKVVKITKIDKEIPQVKLIKSSATNKEIVLTVSIIDSLSGVEKISFNNGSYSNNKNYKVTKTGTYSVQVIDRAGNVSNKSTIKIQDSDFADSSKIEKTYTITFDGNGASTSKNYVSCTTTKDSCQITTPTITKNGSKILGWATTSNATTAKYKVGQKITISKNQKLYAITYKTYTATFDKNGADTINKTSASCKVYNKNTSCSVASPTITRNGATVVGWGTKATDTTVIAKEKGIIALSADKTYYAVTYKTATAIFNKNGADSISKTSASCKAYNKSKVCKVTSPTITKNGSKILGWATANNATTVLASSGGQVSATYTFNQNYYAITSKTFTATFDKNGADSIGASSLSCTAYNSYASCNVKMPTITRSGGTVIGWNTVASATTSSIGVGSTLTLKSNVKYYAITKKTVTATFSNVDDTVAKFSYNTANCTLYNANACSIKFPFVTRNGKTIMGFSTKRMDNNPPYIQGGSTNISNNITFYVRTGTVGGSGIVRVPAGTINVTGIKNAPNNIIVIEYDSSCSSSAQSYATALKTIYNKAPYIFRIHKLFLVSDTTWNNTWSSKSAVGMQHGIAQAQAIDIKCSYFTDYSGREATLVHELAHSMDGYYVLQSGGYMYKNFTTLYNKYNISSSPFSSYSKTSDLEFFAEIYRHYYYTYLSTSNSSYKVTNYPSDVKSKLEQYINSAKTKW